MRLYRALARRPDERSLGRRGAQGGVDLRVDCLLVVTLARGRHEARVQAPGQLQLRVRHVVLLMSHQQTNNNQTKLLEL